MPLAEEPMEYEVYDIFEGGYLCARSGKPFIEDKVRENIEYALKEHGVWEEGMSVVIPAGALAEADCENGVYQYDFEVFNGLDKVVYHGTAYGTLVCYLDEYKKSKDICDIYAELNDMTVELHKVE